MLWGGDYQVVTSVPSLAVTGKGSSLLPVLHNSPTPDRAL